jgi:hypothetical protein
MSAFVRTPVLPEPTPVRVLSALLRHSSPRPPTTAQTFVLSSDGRSGQHAAIPPSRRGFLWPAGNLAAQTAGSQAGLVESGRTATSTHCQASRQPAKGARAPERQSAEPPPRDAGSSRHSIAARDRPWTLQTVDSLGKSWVVLRIDKFIWRARNPNEMRRKGGQPPCRVVALRAASTSCSRRTA